jgi:glycosyltransferase involved in cell wall biosynthesis
MRRFLIWYWSATGGGGSQYAVNLACRLSRRFGPEAICLSLHQDDPLLERAHSYAFETRSAGVFTSRQKPVRTLLSLGDSARVLAAHARDCDAVLIPMNFASAAPLAQAVTKPLVYFAHDPAPHPGDHAGLGQRMTQRLLIERAAYVVALSFYAVRELERRGVPKKKLAVAPLSAVFEPRVGATRVEGPMRLLFAGRMISYKGCDVLADALSVVSRRLDWRVTIAGEGPALDRAMRARFESDRIEVRTGWMSESALDELVASADILVAPYRSATQSGVVAQALARGRPCIVNPVGALAEQIGDGHAGWIAADVDVYSLTEVIEHALGADGLWCEKAHGATEIATRAWDEDCWSWLEAG